MGKFYDREQELRLINKLLKAPGVSLVIVKGIRRVGKTSLILKALEEKSFINLFIPKDKTPALFLEESASELKVPRFVKIVDFFRYLFEHHEIIFMDEFQNFYSLDKSVYSDLQKLFEEMKQKNKKLCLLVTGSSYSLIKKIFSDYAKALYGRKDAEINLEELPVSYVCAWLRDLGITDLEEQIQYWSLFGGMPKFYDTLGKISPANFKDFLSSWLKQGRTMIDEGSSILISEFGGEYKTYYSVMEAIAQGKTKLSEIASVFENDSITANRYIDILRKEYNLVAKTTPLLDNIRTSRQGIYVLKHNFLLFWFAFVKRYENYYEQNRFTELGELVEKNINSFIGRQFESFCLELMKQQSLLPVAFTHFGRQWGKIAHATRDKNQYEIDICGVNDQTREIIVGECKWQELVDAEKIVAGLQEKIHYLPWNEGDRTEYFVVFAKSFKHRIKSKKVFLFDLIDLEKMLKRQDDFTTEMAKEYVELTKG